MPEHVNGMVVVLTHNRRPELRALTVPNERPPVGVEDNGSSDGHARCGRRSEYRPTRVSQDAVPTGLRPNHDTRAGLGSAALRSDFVIRE